jgi:hypothetical protein
MQMHATFPKTRDGRNTAEYAWSDGRVATSPSDGRLGRLPHDLEHYILEAQVDVPYGFWALAGRQAPFKSLALARGRWPKKKVDWFERVKRKHGGAMVQAEAIGGFIGRLARGEADIHRDWPAIRRSLTRAYSYESSSPLAALTQEDLMGLVPFHIEMHRVWKTVPVGGAIRVSWPRTTRPTVVAVAG